AAIIFAPAGELVPAALRNVVKGGAVVCAGIHMSDIPSFPYELLWGERVVRSVANLTRRDGEELFARLRSLRIRTQRTAYPIEYVRDEEAEEQPAPNTLFLRDPTRTIIAHNDSPDVGFESSINPYRGCEHGCIYCFARPTHEYLGFSAGLEFESKILVKEDAP